MKKYRMNPPRFNFDYSKLFSFTDDRYNNLDDTEKMFAPYHIDELVEDLDLTKPVVVNYTGGSYTKINEEDIPKKSDANFTNKRMGIPVGEFVKYDIISSLTEDKSNQSYTLDDRYIKTNWDINVTLHIKVELDRAKAEQYIKDLNHKVEFRTIQAYYDVRELNEYQKDMYNKYLKTLPSDIASILSSMRYSDRTGTIFAIEDECTKIREHIVKTMESYGKPLYSCQWKIDTNLLISYLDYVLYSYLECVYRDIDTNEYELPQWKSRYYIPNITDVTKEYIRTKLVNTKLKLGIKENKHGKAKTS